MTARAVLREFKEGSYQGKAGLIARHPGQPLSFSHRIGKFLTGFLDQPRFVVEQVDLRRGARLEQKNDPLGLGFVVEPSTRLGMKHVGQSNASESSAESL